MAKTKQRRRRKHRGTQGGRVDTRPRGRPSNRAEARQRAKARGKGGGRQQQDRRLQPPSWRSAFGKGLVAALIFFVLLMFAFKRELLPSATLAAFMLAFYVPMGYFVDGFFYRRRMGQLEKAKLEKAQGRARDTESTESE